MGVVLKRQNKQTKWDTVKTGILPKLIYRINTIPVKIPADQDVETNNSKTHMNETKTVKTFLIEKKRTKLGKSHWFLRLKDSVELAKE